VNSTSHASTPVSAQATAREFLTILFRRKWLIIGLFVATTVTVLALTLTAPITYVSAGRLLIKRGVPQSALTPARVNEGNWEEDLGSEMEVIKSYSVVSRAEAFLKSEMPAGTKVPKVQVRDIGVAVVGKSNAILVSYTDRDPKVAQQICDAVIRAYIDYRQTLVALPFPKVFFDTQLHEVESELGEKVELRRNYLAREGVVEIDFQGRKVLDLVGVLDERRTLTRSNLVEAQSELQTMKELSENPLVDVPFLGDESTLQDLKQKIINEQARIAQLRERYLDHAPEVVAAQSTLDTLRKMLKEEVNARLIVAQTKVKSLQARLNEEERDAARARAEIAAMPVKERTISGLDRDIKLLTERRTELVSNRDRALVNENTTPNINVILLDPAEEAEPRNPRDKVRLALAPAFSLVVGIGLAFFLDGLDLTVRTSGHAEQALELPVLASLPDRRRRRDLPAEGHGS
jgi:uncharacterized protein involved in exopolysaccharide biosynthesis